jgi:hypothetical protein
VTAGVSQERRAIAASLGALLLGATALAGAAGCGESVTFAYFEVDVTVDQTADREFLGRITSCGVEVDGPHKHSGDLRCQRGAIQDHKLGKFEYSTSASSGTVTFTVVLKDLNGKDLARGQSDPVTIVPNKTTQAQVLVKPLPEALEPPNP